LILYRKGGDPLDWATCGANVYVPVSTIVQIGAVEWTGPGNTSGVASQALHGKYGTEPMIFVQVKSTSPAGAYLMTKVSSAGDAVEISWKSDVNITIARFYYIAYGSQLRSG
jgi:enterochelin esterase-like enzyme